MNPEQPYRGSRGGKVCFPTSFGLGRHVLAAGTLAGALIVIVCAPAQAQNAVDIDDRIEATFDLVLGNSAELAVPLTRRALVRRSIERNGDVAPLPYRATGEDAAPEALALPDEDQADAVEQGSTEDDTELARLPRPRPIAISEATGTRDLIGQPLDLVAGAAVAVPEQAAEAAPSETSGVVVAAASREEEEPAPLIVPANPAAPAPELVAAEACLSVDDVTDKDGDFKRNAEVLSGGGLCMAQEEFRERRRPWVVQTVKSRQPGPLWAVMHDDENLSFDTAVKALTTYGGTLVSVDTGGKRNLSGIDPNRNFSGDGIGCRKLGDNAAPRFTKLFRDFIDPSQPIVALHNNTEERSPTGGHGHVTMDLVPKAMRASPAPDVGGPLAGERALVLLAASDLDDPTAASRTAILNGTGINVVLERVEDGRGDCSLSNYAVLIDNPNYFNVTVGHGEGDKQMRIVDTLMSGRSDTVASQ